MKKKLKIAFIGAGRISEQHLKVFKQIKYLEFAGIYSRTKKKADVLAKKYKIQQSFNSIKELYEKTKSDLVIISVSVENMKEVCLEASKYSWKCLVEKPFGHNLEEALYLKKKLTNKNQFYIALNRSHYSTTQKIIEKLKRDKSKRLIYINDQQNIKNEKKNYPKKILNNFMYANSIHLVDFIRIFARGKLINIKTIFNLKTKYSYSFSRILNFSSGDMVIFSSFWERPAPWSLNISTDNYFFDMKPLENLKIINKNKNNKIIFKQNYNDIKFKPGFMRQAQEIIKKIKNKRNYFPGIEEAIYTTKLINKIF